MKKGIPTVIRSRGFVSLICSLTIGLLLTGPSASRAASTVALEKWVAHYCGACNREDRAQELAVDDEGNVYVTGYSDGGDTGLDFATVKYDPAGNKLWVARYNGPGNGLDGYGPPPYPVTCSACLSVDDSSNAYVTGASEGDGTERDYATIKYDPDGNELWVARDSLPEFFKSPRTRICP